MMNYYKEESTRQFAWLITAIVVLLIGCAVWFATMETSTKAENYAMTCKVVELDHEEDLVILVDANGFEWAWEGIEDWEIGDCASLLMNDNGTPEIEDDTILSMRYNAWGLS